MIGLWRRLVCRLRGHVPWLYDVRATVEGLWVESSCMRCGRPVVERVRVAEPPRLRVFDGGGEG